RPRIPSSARPMGADVALLSAHTPPAGYRGPDRTRLATPRGTWLWLRHSGLEYGDAIEGGGIWADSLVIATKATGRVQHSAAFRSLSEFTPSEVKQQHNEVNWNA